MCLRSLTRLFVRKKTVFFLYYQSIKSFSSETFQSATLDKITCRQRVIRVRERLAYDLRFIVMRFEILASIERFEFPFKRSYRANTDDWIVKRAIFVRFSMFCFTLLKKKKLVIFFENDFPSSGPVHIRKHYGFPSFLPFEHRPGRPHSVSIDEFWPWAANRVQRPFVKYLCWIHVKLS